VLLFITANFHEHGGEMLQTRPKDLAHPTGIIPKKLSVETSTSYCIQL